MATLGNVSVQITVDVKGLNQGLANAENQLKRFTYSATDLLRDAFGVSLGIIMAQAVYKVQHGFKAMVGAAIGFNDMLDRTQVALTKMSGSVDQGSYALQRLKELSLKTPFDFEDILVATTRFKAFGFTIQETVDQFLPAVLDIAAAFNVTSGDLVNRLALALGQMLQKGKVVSQEMRQLAEAGIPAWEILARELGVSIDEAMKMVEKRMVDSRTFFNAFFKYWQTNFKGLAQTMTQTWSGAWSVIKKATQLGIATAFKPLFDVLKSLLAEFTRPLQELSTIQNLVAPIASIVASLVKPFQDILTIWRQWRSEGASALGSLRVLIAALNDPTSELGQKWGWVAQVWQVIGPGIKALIGFFMELASVIRQILPTLASFAAAATQFFVPLLNPITALLKLLQQFGPLLQALTVYFLAFKTAAAISSVISPAINSIRQLSRAVAEYAATQNAAALASYRSALIQGIIGNLLTASILAYILWADQINNAVISVANSFAKFPEVVSKSLQAAVNGITSFARAFTKLPQIVREVFQSIINTITSFARGITKAINAALNPWAKHSPSLVENVESGTQQIIAYWQDTQQIIPTMDEIADAVDRINKALGNNTSISDEVRNNLDKIGSKYPDIINDVITLADAYDRLKEEADAVKAELDVQEAVLKSLENQLKAAQKEYDRLRDKASELRDSINAVEKAIKDLMAAPLVGEGAMLEAMDELDKQIRRKKLEIAQAELQQLETQAYLLDLGFQFSGSPIDLLKFELEKLQKQREVLSLEYEINFEEPRKELEKLGKSFLEGTQIERTFEELTQAIIEQGQALQALRQEYDSVTQEMNAAEQQVKALQEAVDAQRELVETLREAYSQLTDQLSEIENALKDVVESIEETNSTSVSIGPVGISFAAEGISQLKEVQFDLQKITEILNRDIPEAVQTTATSIKEYFASIGVDVDWLNQKIQELQAQLDRISAEKIRTEIVENFDQLISYFPDLPNYFGDLWDTYIRLKDEAARLNEELERETEILSDLETKLKDAQRAFDEINDYVKELEDSIRDVIDQMNELTEAPLLGQSDLENQMRDIEKQMRRLRLEAAQIELGGGDPQRLKQIREQLDQLEKQRDVLRLRYEIEIEEPRDELKRLAESFDESKQQGEQSFDAIASKIKELGGTLGSLRSKLDEAILIREERKAALDEIKKQYDEQKEKVDNLRNSYDLLNGKIRDLEDIFNRLINLIDKTSGAIGGLDEALGEIGPIEIDTSELQKILDEGIKVEDLDFSKMEEEFRKAVLIAIGFSIGSAILQAFILAFGPSLITALAPVIMSALAAIGAFIAGPVGVGILLTAIPLLIVGALWKAGKLDDIANAIKNFVKGIWEKIREFFKTGWKLITGDWGIDGGGWGRMMFIDPTVFSGLASKIIEGFNGIKSTIGEKVGEWKDTIVTKIDEWKDAIAGKLGEIGEKFKEGFGTAKEKVIEKFNEIKTEIETKLGEAKDKVGEKLGEIKGFFEEKFGGAWSTTKEKFGGIKGEIEEKLGFIKGEVDSKLGEVKGFFESKFGDVWSITKDKFGGIKGEVEEKLGFIKNEVSSKLDEVKGFFETKFGEVKSKTGEILGNLKNDVSGWFTNNFIPFWQDKWGEVKSKAEGLFGDAKETIKNGFTEIKNTANWMWDHVKGPLQNFWDKINDIRTLIVDFVQNALSWLSQKFSIVFEPLLSGGWLRSVLEFFRDIFGAIKSAVDALTGAISSLLGPLSNAINKLGDFINKMKEAGGEVYNWFMDQVNKVGSSLPKGGSSSPPPPPPSGGTGGGGSSIVPPPNSPFWTVPMQTGAWKIMSDTVALLHKGEMVVPEPFAEGLRREGKLGPSIVVNIQNIELSNPEDADIVGKKIADSIYTSLRTKGIM
jgi:tape measure domain-containing protein